MTSKRERTESGRSADDEVTELSFDEGPAPRFGELLPAAELKEELPPERVRTAGMSSGEALGPLATDDDLSPETLFHEEEDYELYGPERPTDQTLQVVDASHIGGGFGKDEAELAREEHPGP